MQPQKLPPFSQFYQLLPEQLEAAAIRLFRQQARHNRVYKKYIKLLGVQPDSIDSIYDIPFLPIELFKNQRVLTGYFPVQQTFRSSGTTGNITSSHYVCDIKLYENSFTKTFQLFYGDITQYAILALLPAYLERLDSSLVYMANYLIKASKCDYSNFYLYNYAQLAETVAMLEAQGKPTLLLGVTFALLDFAEQFPMPLRHTIIIETGGMKGRRREMVRPEVHDILQQAFGTPHIHSEYGMTELLSQAYSKGDGIFNCPPWMRIVLRDVQEPTATLRTPIIGKVENEELSLPSKPTTGAINVIDLANIYSCAFIATADLGRQFPDGSFEVLGRMDNSDVRGCNLLVE